MPRRPPRKDGPKCTACGKRRQLYGKVPRHDVCKPCWRKAHPREAHYYCISAEGCRNEVSGPNRHCQRCNAAKMREAKASRQLVMEKRGDRQGRQTDTSWWARPDYQGDRQTAQGILSEQMDRFRAAGIGKERPALGMPAGGYANGYLG